MIEKKIFTRDNLLLGLVLAFAAVLRFIGLASRDIWYDEVLSVLQAGKSLVQISKDVATPFHYYIVHWFLLLGKNTFILGIPSVLFGVGSVLMLYLIGKKAIDKNTGLLAAFLLAISPMHIEFSQQILHYSYFVFFTLLSLYFYLKFILSFQKEKVDYKSLFLLLLSNGLNILTHVSALLIIEMQLIFLVVFLLLQKKPFVWPKIHIVLLLLVGIVGTLAALSFGDGYYLNLLLKGVRFGPHHFLELGYSLSKQMDTNILSFNKQFFMAMFSWFGLGGGGRLYLYLTLFTIGVISILLRRKIVITLCLLFWLVFPFLQLYYIRPVHWFEEKYFIFMIPVYLLLLACGVIFILEIFKKNFFRIIQLIKDRSGVKIEIAHLPFAKDITKYFFQSFVVVILFVVALNPIKVRTTYGFPVENWTKYSWKQVHSFLEKTMQKGDRVFVRRGEGLFFEYYFGSEKKNEIWFEEDFILTSNSQQYLDFIRKDVKNYFVCIPEFYDTILASMADYEKISSTGNFNIYEISFKKESSVKVRLLDEKHWEYYDGYRTAKYFSEAHDWCNVSLSYIGTYNVPMTYGYYCLCPREFSEAWIDYKFILPENAKIFYIRPVFTIPEGVHFRIHLGENPANIKQVYEKTANALSHFYPTIKVSRDGSLSQELFLRLVFDFDEHQGIDAGEVNLKSILLTNKDAVGVNSYEEKMMRGGRSVYFYDSQLEVFKSNKWLYDCIQRDGWIQATDGILFNLWGKPEETPLVYKFNFKEEVFIDNLELKTYTFNNKISVSMSEDGEHWTELGVFDDGETTVRNFEKDRFSEFKKIKTFYLRFLGQKAGPTCQLRNLSLTAMTEE